MGALEAGREPWSAAETSCQCHPTPTESDTSTPAELDRIFDRFHRTDAGRDRRRGGTGLGLAIARALVEAHGGRIWAESHPGAGATRRFELPRFRA